MFALTRHYALIVVAAFVAAIPGSCAAASAQEARAIVSSASEAVVTVEAVVEVKMSYEGMSDNEQLKLSANATVISPSGLSVTALSEIDPTGISHFIEEGEGLSYSVDIAGMKLRLQDGTEIPADLVGRDPDLDLAFIRPKKVPESPMTCIDLSQATTVDLLDEVLVLWRLGKAGNRALAASMEKVQAVVSKPRTLYIIYNHGAHGGPVLTPDGKPVGIAVSRADRSPASGRDAYSDFDQLDVVLPAATVMQAVVQLSNQEE